MQLICGVILRIGPILLKILASVHLSVSYVFVLIQRGIGVKYLEADYDFILAKS